MRVLIAEDDQSKAKQLGEFVAAEVPEPSIITRASYQSSLDEAVNCPPDVILLDMSMPTFDRSATERGGRYRYFAGREILHEIKRKGVQTKVIVVTQFDRFGEKDNAMSLPQLKKQLAAEFPCQYLGTVFYSPSESDWKGHLAQLLSRV
jgi:DNA-binding NarL/FixJ family response regulator